MTRSTSRTSQDSERVRFPEIVSRKSSSAKTPLSQAARHHSTAEAEHQRNLKKIKFFPCSPGQILQMAKLLGVEADKEFYLLPLVKKAVTATFPQDWAIELDKNGQTYYYNIYTHKVITVHPLSDVFIEWIEAARRQHEEEEQLFRERLEADGLTEDAVENHLQGDIWMKFTTSQEDEEYWFNFKQNRLYSLIQYQHVLQLELEDRRTKVTVKENPRKMEDKAKELKLRNALGLFTGNITLKYWLRWTAKYLALRNAQAQALVKSGMVNGRQEAKGFRQWKEKVQQLAFVRRVMQPLGGRRDKAIVRDIFNIWKDVVIDQIEEKKESLTVKEYFSSWKQMCSKKKKFDRVKEVIRSMLLGSSLSVNFLEWAAVAKDKKDREVELMTKACIAIQRGFRERLKKKNAARALQNKRKQIKMQLLKLSDNMESTVSLYAAKDLMAQSSILREEPEEIPRSFAVCLLEGAMVSAHTETEKTRLRQVLRNAKAKIVVSPEEEGFGTFSVQSAISRVVDLLDPIDKVHLRARLEALEHDPHARADAALRGDLQTLSDAVDGLVTNIAESRAGGGGGKLMLDPAERAALLEQEGSTLARTAEAVKRVLDGTLRPEARSKQVGEALVTEAVTMLDELDVVMDRFLTIVDSKKAAADGW